MTNAELDRARAEEARKQQYDIGASNVLDLLAYAARLAREGWTPPVAVDPEVGSIWKHYNGNVYEVIAIANTLDTEKYPKAVIHKNTANGTVWTRRSDDWHRSYTQQAKTSEPLVDPDLALAKTLSDEWGDNDEPTPEQMILRAIKRGRALAAAEAKPRMVWVKHDGSIECPVNPDSYVWVKRWALSPFQTAILMAGAVGWPKVTHYAIITPPDDAA